MVVVLLAMDFWNCRVRAPTIRFQPRCSHYPQNVSGRTLVGLRFWNQVLYSNARSYDITPHCAQIGRRGRRELLGVREP